RDIKPANLLVDLKGTVKILDLGLAKFAAKSSAVADSEQDHVLGTADYLAPEQVVDSQAVDHRADIYALGGTLYYLLSGHPPFAHGTTLERLTAHQQQLPPSLLLDRPDAPAALVAICRRMLEKSPSSRFQTAAEVARDLNAWLDGEAQAGRWRPQELMAAASARTGSSSAAKRPSATREAESHINLISGSATDLHRAAGEALSPVPSLTDTDPNLQRKTVRIPTSRPQLPGQRQPGGSTTDVFAAAPSAPTPAEHLPGEAGAKSPLSLVGEPQSENWEGQITPVTSAIDPFAPRVGEIDERQVLRMHRASARSANWLWVVFISGLVLAALALAISALPS
ncbi:MAG TPA: serine/threonine-protein kinase, partial [Pirellulales bacterium]|nr:serine/threonine-protein kinase [Pirellulales bacterium]